MNGSEWRGRIGPVPSGEPGPLWSVMIPAFNCAQYLAKTLESVLAQDPGQNLMQIEVVDDHSTMGDPAEVARTVGRGRVGFHQQPANVGHIRNFETCISRARGRLVHLLHGDDYVLDGFYKTMERAFRDAPGCGAAFCRSAYLDSSAESQSLTPLVRQSPGILPNAAATLALEQVVMTPAMVVRRSVYERLGAFDSRLMCAEDWEMWVRIASHYPVWFEPQPLAVYRMHSDSNTGRNTRSGRDARYIHLAIDLMAAYLPAEQARSVTLRTKKTYARSAIDTATSLLQRRDFEGARNVAREAFRLSRSPGVLLHALRSTARLVFP
jgi:glycosyltransferase involved in cell wall biosynthesis